jgi:hypothetical protein
MTEHFMFSLCSTGPRCILKKKSNLCSEPRSGLPVGPKRYSRLFSKRKYHRLFYYGPSVAPPSPKSHDARARLKNLIEKPFLDEHNAINDDQYKWTPKRVLS